MFGTISNNNNTTTNSTGGLFGSNAAATTGLFGTNNTNSNNFNNTPVNGGGLFGNKSTVNTGGGLFGSNNNPNSNTNSLFGNNNNNASINTGGLFGNNNNNNNNTATNPGGLFGAKQATTGGGLFQNNNNNNTTGLFGNTNTGVTTTGNNLFNSKPSLFGNTNNFANNNNNNNNNNNALGGGLSGQQQQFIFKQQQSNLQMISQLAITPMTKINELPLPIKQEIEQLDQYIQQQLKISYQLKADMSEHLELIESIPRDIDFLNKIYFNTNQALDKYLLKVTQLRKQTDKSINHSEISNIIIQQLTSNNPNSKISYSELDSYFQKKMKSYRFKLNEYLSVLGDIEVAIQGLENYMFINNSNNNNNNNNNNNSNSSSSSSSSSNADMLIQNGTNAIIDSSPIVSIINTVIAEFELFMKTAERIAELHQRVKEIVSHNNATF
ncbi:FG-nucleoporin NUP49 SCDLUD_001403 [Saccharomycodes ludwigii]|uniref:FG-nucleoporin NUP49 n=1 Tax=Saccharomycodes ludwigii TaxID=36035 RepID=UPI001E8C214F|nr:hypothetical protein SCDLUD_001403 [Saccharomycodes ludwigii]KAH3901637.1 hypothetical protein SCDLUD_001403 [Saccharomycodes ludwigii]